MYALLAEKTNQSSNKFSGRVALYFPVTSKSIIFAPPKIKTTNIRAMCKTSEEYDRAVSVCRDIFSKKLKDYGASWRILRPESLTDQLFIKAKRIRSIEVTGVSMVGDGIFDEFVAIVNYGVVGLIQLELGCADSVDINYTRGLALYDKYIEEAKQLMLAKNHDYGEAWRDMRISSYTDLILQKICRTKQIEDNRGNTLVSEGADANYLDMINYAMFGLIKLQEAAG